MNTTKRFPPKLKPRVEIPNAVGVTLTQEQIETIAQTVYTRFVMHDGLPDWKSAFATDIRKTTIDMVKKVTDSMVINSFTIQQLGIKGNETA